MKPGDEYTCSVCDETYTAVIGDAEALAETEEIFGAEVMNGPMEIVCDDCWRKMMGLPPIEEVN